ncbi:MAG TPA: DUF5615 family PIN-like protein [Bryobacteraceae bacterium]
MRKFSLYVDEDAARASLVDARRRHGIPVASPIEEKMTECADEKQLQFACTGGHVLYTFNISDFYALHTHWLATARHHTGLILARNSVTRWRATATNFAPARC